MTVRHRAGRARKGHTMIIKFSQTIERSLEISQADLVKLMDDHSVPAAMDGESVADRFERHFGLVGELDAAVIETSDVDGDDVELEEIEDEDEDEDSEEAQEAATWREPAWR